jgi:MFS family permease
MNQLSAGTSASALPGSRWFYGWNIVAIAFAAEFAVAGFTQYGYSVFVLPLSTTFNASIFLTMMGLSVMSIMTGLLSPWTGRLIQRHSIKHIMILGCLILAVGFFIASFSKSIWHILSAYGLIISLGAALVAPIAASTLVNNWFVTYRGRAVALSMIGTSVGGFIVPPLLTWMIQLMGWQWVFRFFIPSVFLLLAPIIYCWAINRPDQLGLYPDGQLVNQNSNSRLKTNEWVTVELLKSRAFWVIAGALGLAFLVFMGVMANVVPHASTLGVDAQFAALLVSCIAVSGVVSKLTLGVAIDRWGAKATFIIALCCECAGCILFSQATHFYSLVTAAFLLGYSSGGLYPVWPGFIVEQFGRGSLAQVMGLMSPIILIALVVGAPLAGLVFDQTGSYRQVFCGFAGLLLLAGSATILLKKRSV